MKNITNDIENIRSQKKKFFYLTKREKTRSLSLIRSQFQFDILTRISRLKNTNTNFFKQKNVIYLNMFEYLYNNSQKTQIQNQTIQNNNINKKNTLNLNLNYEDLNIKTKIKILNKIFSTYVMLNSFVIKRKNKHKIVCTQTNKRIIVNLTLNDTKNYRCTFRNNTRDLI